MFAQNCLRQLRSIGTIRLGNTRRFLCTATEQPKSTKGEVGILEKLKAHFPTAMHIIVEDISGGCGTMYQIQVTSDEFRGKTLVEQHKEVGEVLKEEVKCMHGIRIFTQIPKDGL